VQIADLGGPVLVSMVAFVFNGALFETIQALLEHRRPSWRTPAIALASVALTLGYGLEQWGGAGGEVVVWNSATEGCGIADEGTLREMSFREEPVSDRCRSVAATRERQIEEFDPDVVVVLTSVWDLQERRLPEWDDFLRPGDPEFDEYLLREYREAADVLSSRGARIVWVQAPCARSPSGDPSTATSSGPYETARVRHLNEVIAPRLAEGRDDLALFDLFDIVCPEGEFVESLGGVEELRPDGVHFSRDGAMWLAETHGEALLGAGL